MKTYEAVRNKCQSNFTELVPGRYIDLLPVGEAIEDGLQFVLYDGSGKYKTGNSIGDDNNSIVNVDNNARDIDRNTRSVTELSGGQRAMLGLAFVFATALYKASPLYMLDEIDAALDETNQQAIGRSISKLFNTSQVICISHHTSFQTQAENRIPIIMKNGITVLDS